MRLIDRMKWWWAPILILLGSFLGGVAREIRHERAASGILTEGGDAKQAPGESLSSPVASASPTTDAQQPDPQDTSHKRMGE